MSKKKAKPLNNNGTMEEAEKTFKVGTWYPSSECPNRSDYEVLAWYEHEDGGQCLRILHRYEKKMWHIVEDSSETFIQDNALICWTPLPDMPYATRLKIQDEKYRKHLETVIHLATNVEDIKTTEQASIDEVQDKLDELEILPIHSKEDFEVYTKQGYKIQ